MKEHKQHEPGMTMVGTRKVACCGCSHSLPTPNSWSMGSLTFVGDKHKPMDARSLWNAASQYDRTR